MGDIDIDVGVATRSGKTKRRQSSLSMLVGAGEACMMLNIGRDEAVNTLMQVYQGSKGIPEPSPTPTRTQATPAKPTSTRLSTCKPGSNKRKTQGEVTTQAAGKHKHTHNGNDGFVRSNTTAVRMGRSPKKEEGKRQPEDGLEDADGWIERAFAEATALASEETIKEQAMDAEEDDTVSHSLRTPAREKTGPVLAAPSELRHTRAAGTAARPPSPRKRPRLATKTTTHLTKKNDRKMSQARHSVGKGASDRQNQSDIATAELLLQLSGKMKGIVKSKTAFEKGLIKTRDQVSS